MAKIAPVSKPTHSLATVKALAAKSGARELTTRATQTAASELGMSRDAVFAAVAALTAGDFHKSMESETFPGRFQDVYRPTVKCPSYPAGAQVYCKVEIADGALLLHVISFKKK